MAAWVVCPVWEVCEALSLTGDNRCREIIANSCQGAGGDFGGIDFSKLGAGGAGGMPDLGGLGQPVEGIPGWNGAPEEGEDDMPDLEGEEAKDGKAAGAADKKA